MRQNITTQAAQRMVPDAAFAGMEENSRFVRIMQDPDGSGANAALIKTYIRFR
jgi:hypothetical protein